MARKEVFIGTITINRTSAVAEHSRAAVFFDVAEPLVVGEVGGEQEIRVPQAPEVVAYGALAEAIANTLHNGQEVIVVGTRRDATRSELAGQRDKDAKTVIEAYAVGPNLATTESEGIIE
jgi:single-stranded DNA-binding protein